MKNGISFIGGTVLGAAIGALVALAFAPKAGKELREEVKTKYDETSLKLAEQAKEARVQLEAKTNEARAQLESKTSEARTQLSGKADEARHLFIEKRDQLVERVKTLRAPKAVEMNGIAEVAEA